MEFVAGLGSGIAQTIIGHPLDTIKVNQQNNIKINKNFYRGIRYPLICNSILVGMQFDLYYRYNSFIDSIITSTIITPLDYYKIKQQNQMKPNFKLMLQNFKKAYPITVIRESIAISIYFGSYDYMKNKMEFHPLIAGGIAGCSSWLFTYPIDTIKTRVQSDIALKDAIMTKKYFGGLGVTLLRASIVNSVGFFVAENIKNNLNIF